ncbi:MAG TPA: cytochrome ubiquinol oxidase subunit I [Polyangiaceae bacterium]|nr:cytochrome ubiquinol oxidase subunit I [Polyangiaceae bacterium]
MGDALVWHRLQFAFTAIYHYVFPQLTMGLAPVIAWLRLRALRDPRGDDAALADFLARIFAVNFAFGVVTGIPMEFQFGTNWAGFSRFAGGVIGQTLAMEGVFAFFLESTFLGVLLWGGDRVGPRGKLAASMALWAGSWLSAYFIVATNAFLQHPQGSSQQGGVLVLEDLGALVGNRWALAEFAHVIVAAVVTGAFVVAAIGAYYTLSDRHAPRAARLLALGTTLGLVAGFAVAFPTGDQQAKLVARHQPVGLAAMEGRFETGPMAGITLIGQPNIAERKLDNPIRVPGALSFLAYGTFHSDVRGLDDFPPDLWPQNIELLYYSFHVMAGLGTIMIALMALAILQRLRRRLDRSRLLLWALMLSFPLPYIANTAGWITAELGRQPWLVYGILRTRDGASPTVHSGDALFTLIGFCGLYLVMGVLYVLLVGREILHGPGAGSHATAAPEAEHG